MMNRFNLLSTSSKAYPQRFYVLFTCYFGKIKIIVSIRYDVSDSVSGKKLNSNFNKKRN
jgi:hypothetical protein